ncbi:Vacuolar protein sorting-associated protein 8-like protein [Erysiphe neolycopersici]|uniref:Vacuolar protein sorting-associated protein 8-like protein n=1 Tax=Erysiphe neolycopersici TaxID=212602 RepID=A0A420HGX3_9PEZI|nr:Vacuolar protein sorting-associated protein 8-like protein [Erysiphe neolycopersici]
MKIPYVDDVIDSMGDSRNASQPTGSSPANLELRDELVLSVGECIANSTSQEGESSERQSHLGRVDLDQYIFSENRHDSNEKNTLPDGILNRTHSPADSFLSIPDDSPSVQGSVRSCLSGSVDIPSVTSRPDLESSPLSSFRPFDRRFHSRLSSPNLSTLRVSSPINLNNQSRGTSISSTSSHFFRDNDSSSPAWEVIRWTKLRKINGQAFSEVGKRNFGTPTCISISSSVALGTSKGIILIFDYHQNLKSIVGPGTKGKSLAVEAGPLTSIAVSADHLVIAGGHANGSIFTWELSRTASPFLHIPSLDPAQIKQPQDGHLLNFAVRHLGFLGTRHTALVSADDHGMAFSHLATRGLGSFGRTVKSTRILGRYPDDKATTTGKPRNRSTILAFSPLPLGNVEFGSNSMGLTAMLTPYLLVIVSTTPVAQTQFKTRKPKCLDTYTPLSGCLAWFPAVKLKIPDPKTEKEISNIKIVYCWSNMLSILDVQEIQQLDNQPNLSFRVRSKWSAEEAIVAVQWLSRSVLAALTITQRLIILEDYSMRVIDTFDLLNKHIYHQSIFSEQLKIFIEQLSGGSPKTPIVIADSYHMSFKAYKSRLFLVGFNSVTIGTLSSWSDRLIETMRNGDYIGAIQLATCYYTGNTDNLIIGLPDDSSSRHSLLHGKLIEIMRASLKFAFGKIQQQDQKESDENLKYLAEACLEACLSIDDSDFLFDEVYEWYENGGSTEIFLKALEIQILEKRITVIPPAIVKTLVTDFVSQGLETRLEDIICHIDPLSLDIDQITTLCKQHNLYDALIYVWNRALRDYITPLIEILSLLIISSENGNYRDIDASSATKVLKIFPYLSYTFTGRIYPTGEDLDEPEANFAKADLYWFLFSGKTIKWPKASGNSFLTKPFQDEEPTFPYLRLILKFDTPSFLSVMNEAFEDTFLNSTSEQTTGGGNTYGNLPEKQGVGTSINRQYIITILLEVINPSDFEIEQMIYLDMFIARNLPKFTQYLLLPSSILHKVLIGLCKYPSQQIADDAQLSTEYLLSVYQPPNMPQLLPLFHKIGFYRVLKRIYKSEQQYAKLLEISFEDPSDRYSVFNCIYDCLRPNAGLKKRQTLEVYDVILGHAIELLNLDTVRTAQLLHQYASELHEKLLDSLSQKLNLKYVYLCTIYKLETSNQEKSRVPQRFLVEYIQLMCKFDPSKVMDFVENVQINDLNLDEVLPYIEESGVIEAVVVLMTRDGQFEHALNRLIKHLRKLEAEFVCIFSSFDKEVQLLNEIDAVKNLLAALQKFSSVGIWLCDRFSRHARRHMSSPPQIKSTSKTELLIEEIFWLDLIDVLVQIAQNLSTRLESLGKASSNPENQCDFVLSQLRTPIQSIFSRLLMVTSPSTSFEMRISFPRILRAFLARAARLSPRSSDLRAVLASIFSAYTYEEKILQLMNRLLEKDLFIDVEAAMFSRQRGWRPRGFTCEGCGLRVWGPGIKDEVYYKWEEREVLDIKRRKSRGSKFVGGFTERGKAPAYPRYASSVAESIREDYGQMIDDGVLKKNKTVNAVIQMDQQENNGEASDDQYYSQNEDNNEDEKKHFKEQSERDMGPLVVLACRHIYHQSCLEKIQDQKVDSATTALYLEEREFKCPIERL